jgi:branched-chain amino acid aminotransferase
VLDSATNRVLEQCARDLGLKTQRRNIKYDEVSTFTEVGACGTAVVLTPVTSLTRGTTTHRFPTFATLERLRNRVIAIQQGDIPDEHGWLHSIE